MFQWRIYYDNGTTFDDQDGSPEDAPAHGLIAIVQRNDEVGRTVTNGWDYYYYNTDPKGEGWWGCEIHGLLDRLFHNLPVSAVKQGRTATTDVWHSVFQKAIDDPDFPKKSARLKRERPFQKVGW
jgi:hypothetical protein